MENGEHRGEVDRLSQGDAGWIPRACADEDEAVEFLEELRFGSEPFCPRPACGSTDVYMMSRQDSRERNERYLWRCRSCERQFTLRLGTVMENSPIPVHVWTFALWRACTSERGVSAKEIHQFSGLSRRSSRSLMRRIRRAVKGTAGDRLLRGGVTRGAAL